MNFANLLHWALLFLLVAIVAAIFGFGGLAGAATGIARILFWIAIIMAIVSVIANAMRRA